MLLQLLRLVLLLLLVLLLRQAVVLMLLMLSLFRCYFIAQLHPTKKQQTSGNTGEAKNSGKTIGLPKKRRRGRQQQHQHQHQQQQQQQQQQPGNQAAKQ